MKKIIFILLIALNFFACTTLPQVSNNETETKEEEIQRKLKINEEKMIKLIKRINATWRNS